MYLHAEICVQFAEEPAQLLISWGYNAGVEPHAISCDQLY